jgi:hypothetical protein
VAGGRTCSASNGPTGAAKDGLTIRLTADDADALQHLQDMFKARLETIGRRDALVVDW